MSRSTQPRRYVGTAVRRPRPPYEDRAHAGRVLAAAVVARLADRLTNPCVIALPRGGVEVAVPVARALGVQLDILVVRKVGMPDEPEVALGAVDEDGALVLASYAADGDIDASVVQQLADRARSEAVERSHRLRAPGTTQPDVRGRDVVLVDDGYATGMSAIAAARWARRHGAARVVLAVPVGPAHLAGAPPAEFDAVICPATPDPFDAVGLHYVRFEQVPDDVVRARLEDVAKTLSSL